MGGVYGWMCGRGCGASLGETEGDLAEVGGRSVAVHKDVLGVETVHVPHVAYGWDNIRSNDGSRRTTGIP